MKMCRAAEKSIAVSLRPETVGTAESRERGTNPGPPRTDRFFIRDFFVFLQDKSSSNILAKEFRKCNIPET